MLEDRRKKQTMPIGAEKFPVFTKFTGKGQFFCLPEAVIEGKLYPSVEISGENAKAGGK